MKNFSGVPTFMHKRSMMHIFNDSVEINHIISTDTQIPANLLLQRIPLLLNNQRWDFTLGGKTIEEVIAHIATNAGQFFLNTISIAIAHQELVEISANAREREPGSELGQSHMHSAVFIAAPHRLDGTGECAIAGVEF